MILTSYYCLTPKALPFHMIKELSCGLIFFDEIVYSRFSISRHWPKEIDSLFTDNAAGAAKTM